MNTSNILDNEFTNTQFAVYDQFHSQKDAKSLIALLKSNNIPHEVEVPRQLVDTVLGGEAHAPKVFVKVYPHDFQRVNHLVESDMLRLIHDGKIDLKKHFLYDYTDDELIDVLSKPDEWNFDTTIIAKHLLQSRGIELDAQKIKGLQEKRLNEIRKPRQGNKGWLVALSMLSVFGCLFLLWWFVGYLANLAICFGMSYYFWMDVTTDPNGGKFYTFDRQTRNWGKALFMLTIVSNVIFLVAFFWKFS